MEHKNLIDYSQPAPKRTLTEKLLPALCVVVMTVLVALLINGLRMRGVL